LSETYKRLVRVRVRVRVRIRVRVRVQVRVRGRVRGRARVRVRAKGYRTPGTRTGVVRHWMRVAVKSSGATSPAASRPHRQRIAAWC